MCTSTCIYIHAYVCILTPTYPCLSLCVCINILCTSKYVSTYTHVYIYMHMYVHSHLHIPVSLSLYVLTYSVHPNTYLHTHAHRHERPRWPARRCRQCRPRWCIRRPRLTRVPRVAGRLRVARTWRNAWHCRVQRRKCRFGFAFAAPTLEGGGVFWRQNLVTLVGRCSAHEKPTDAVLITAYAAYTVVLISAYAIGYTRCWKLYLL